MQIHLQNNSWGSEYIEEEREKRLHVPEDQGVFCESISPSDIRNDTHEDSLTWLSKQELNNNNRCAKEDLHPTKGTMGN